MKKILLTLTFALVSMYASAYFKVGDIYYQPDEQADDGTCWVRDSPYYGGYDGLTDITIPGRVTYNGRTYRVTSISNEAFKNVTTLTCVRIGWGVEDIYPSAFSGCTNLQYVYLPSTITNIYNYAFQNCTSMIRFGIAASTPPTLGTSPFLNMKKCDIVTALRSSTSAYNAISAWTSADSNGSVSYNGAQANDFENNGVCYIINGSTTASNNDAVLVGIQGGTTYLPMTSSVTDYTNQTYGNGSSYSCIFKEIAPYAAYGHSTLKKIGRSDLGSYFRLTKVGEYAFYACLSLTEVNISAQEIGNYAFCSCSNLATVNLFLKNNENYGTLSLGTLAFAYTGVTIQYIPQTLSSYGDGAFSHCTNLESFSVSSSNSTFTTYAGWLCSKDYKTIYQVGAGDTGVGITGFYDTPTTIKPYCFSGCTKSTKLKIPYGIKTIGTYAFSDSKFTQLLIPSSVTSVGTNAFRNMQYLERLIYNIATPTSGLSFTGVKSGCVLSVPYNNVSNYLNNSTWSSAFTGGINGYAYDLSDPDETGNTTLYFTVTSVGSYSDPVAGSLTLNGQAKVVRGDMPSSLSGTIDIPMRYYLDNYRNFAITEIEDRAFYTFTSLKTVRGGEYIKKIGEKAFDTCWGLTTVNFPNLVTIGTDAFYDCKLLSSFQMGNRLESIGFSAFGNCSALAGEISLPATLSNIGAGAFLNCTSLQGLFLNRTGTTTFGRLFYGNNAANFACFVEIGQFYDFYSKMKTTAYSSDPENDSKKLLPWVKPTTQWTPISVPVDDSVLLPATGEFYTAEQFDIATRSLVLKKLSNDVGINGNTGMLLKGTVGTVYRFRRKTDVSPYVFYGPNKNYLKGVTGDSQTLTYTASGPWNYTFNGSDRFNRVTSSQTINSGSAYVQLAASDVGSVSVSAVYIEDNSTPYNLWINGVQVNNRNYSDLSFIDGVDGTVTYAPGTNTLKLSNATITSNSTDNIRCEISGLKITVTGTSTLETTAGSYTPLRVKKSLSISGSGTLNCYGDGYYGCSVTAGESLTISGGAQVQLRGKYYGINGGSTSCRLIMSGADTKLTAYGQSSASIRYMQPTLSDGLTITTPVGAYFNSDGTVVGANGSPIYSQSVVISKPAVTRGDVNGDGNVNISDATALIDLLLGGGTINNPAADCNNDGNVTIIDLTALIDYLLGGSW